MTEAVDVEERFLEWLCTIKDDRWPTTQRELAEELGVNENVLSRMKSQPDFLAKWETRYRKTVGSPERAKNVLDQLYETAIDRTDPRQVSAAKQYLEAIDAVKPKKLEIVTTSARDMSDDQLYAILADRAARELEERRGAAS